MDWLDISKRYKEEAGSKVIMPMILGTDSTGQKIQHGVVIGSPSNEKIDTTWRLIHSILNPKEMALIVEGSVLASDEATDRYIKGEATVADILGSENAIFCTVINDQGEINYCGGTFTLFEDRVNWKKMQAFGPMEVVGSTTEALLEGRRLPLYKETKKDQLERMGEEAFTNRMMTDMRNMMRYMGVGRIILPEAPFLKGAI